MKQSEKGAVKRYRQVWLWLVLWVALRAVIDSNYIYNQPITTRLCKS